MAVAYDATSQCATSNTTSPVSWSHAGGTPTLALVQVAVDCATSDASYTLSVTYGATTMTSLQRWESGGAAQTTGYIEVFYTTSPAAGTQTVTATLGGSGGTLTGLCGGALTFTGATAVSAAVHSDSNAANAATGSLNIPTTSASNMLAAFVGNGSGSTVFTAGPAVYDYQVRADTTHACGNSAGGHAAGTGSTVSVTWTQTSDFYAAIGLEVQVSSSSATATPAVLAVTTTRPAAQVGLLSGPAWAAAAGTTGTGIGTWANQGNVTGSPDSAYAVWTVV